MEKMSSCDLQLPPGFRFHPTDEELVNHYLCRKCANLNISVPIIAEIDLYKYDPWQLPGLALYGEKEWYFFSPRDRKYPNGSRPNRAAGSGYWKATGADKAVGTPKPVGIKKALVFYTGKAPKGEKTNWIMHEYRLANVDRSARKNNSLRLDDWVLCRVYNKKGEPGSENKPKNLQRKISGIKNFRSGPDAFEDQKPVVLPPHMLQPVQSNRTIPKQMACFGSPEFNVDSSCTEHVPSPEITCESEAHSETRWRSEWDRGLDIPPVLNESGTCSVFSQFGPDPIETGFRDPLQDILMYWGKPF